MTLKSLKTSFGHTTNPALGHPVSNKDHCNFTIQSIYVIKTHSAISNFFKTCGQIDFTLAGFRLEKIITGFYCLTWWQTSVIPKSSWIPAWKHRVSLNFMVSAQLIPWKSGSQTCFPTLGLSGSEHCWVLTHSAQSGTAVSVLSCLSICGLKKVKLLFFPVNALER